MSDLANKNNDPTNNTFLNVLDLINTTKTNVVQFANQSLVKLYWEIGKLVHNEIKYNGWGKATIADLSKQILEQHPCSKGFSPRNIWRMKQFYELYVGIDEKLSTVLTVIGWSNHLHIMTKTNTMEEKLYYLDLASKHSYSARDLARLIDSCVYERTRIANLKLSTPLTEVQQKISPIFKDSYVFEFLEVNNRHTEYDLKTGLTQNMKKFLLEMGPDFNSVGDEYIVQVGDKDFRIDILLHHRDLNCLVAVELKTTEFKPEYLGKLQFYLEALDRDVKKSHENPSVGILICQSKNDEVVEYALSRNTSPAMIAEYKTKLIDKNILQEKLHELKQHTEDLFITSD